MKQMFTKRKRNNPNSSVTEGGGKLLLWSNKSAGAGVLRPTQGELGAVFAFSTSWSCRSSSRFIFVTTTSTLASLGEYGAICKTTVVDIGGSCSELWHQLLSRHNGRRRVFSFDPGQTTMCFHYLSKHTKYQILSTGGLKESPRLEGESTGELITQGICDIYKDFGTNFFGIAYICNADIVAGMERLSLGSEAQPLKP